MSDVVDIGNNYIDKPYGKRMRDFLPWVDPLSDFVDQALEEDETEFELHLNGKSGFRDMNDSKSTWTMTAEAGDIEYVETGCSVPSIRSEVGYRELLDNLGSRIEIEADDEEVSYTIEDVSVQTGVSMY